MWSPYNKCDINKIEAVQRYFTKRLGGLGHMSYCLRLSVLELDSLHLRRIKADLLLSGQYSSMRLLCGAHITNVTLTRLKLFKDILQNVLVV